MINTNLTSGNFIIKWYLTHNGFWFSFGLKLSISFKAKTKLSLSFSPQSILVEEIALRL